MVWRTPSTPWPNGGSHSDSLTSDGPRRGLRPGSGPSAWQDRDGSAAIPDAAPERRALGATTGASRTEGLAGGQGKDTRRILKLSDPPRVGPPATPMGRWNAREGDTPHECRPMAPRAERRRCAVRLRPAGHSLRRQEWRSQHRQRDGLGGYGLGRRERQRVVHARGWRRGCIEQRFDREHDRRHRRQRRSRRWGRSSLIPHAPAVGGNSGGAVHLTESARPSASWARAPSANWRV